MAVLLSSKPRQQLQRIDHAQLVAGLPAEAQAFMCKRLRLLDVAAADHQFGPDDAGAPQDPGQLTRPGEIGSVLDAGLGFSERALRELRLGQNNQRQRRIA